MFISFLKHLKVRLQFTGWLQYIPVAVFALIFFLSAAISWNLNLLLLSYLFAFIAAFFLIVLLFDIATVKFHLHPREHRPKRNDDLEMFDLLRERSSCRSFQAGKLISEDHKEFMNSVCIHSEPSDSSLIGKSSIRFEYISASITVWPVVGASEFLVAIAPSEYNRLAVIDVGRILQKIVIDATCMGIATCWIGPGADQTSVVKNLGPRFNPKQDHVICICAIGYKSRYKPLLLRFVQLLQRRRLPISSLFFTDSNCKVPLNPEASHFKRFGRTFEVCQWSPSAFNGQTTRCVAVIEQKSVKTGQGVEDSLHLVRFDFYAATDSRFYAAVALGIWCANWEMGCKALEIPGYFAVLSTREREQVSSQLPRYDVSWVEDANI